MHYVMNATVVQNIKYDMRCMHEVLTSQVCMQGFDKALPGLSRAESQFGFNLVGQTTARCRKMHKPDGTKNGVQEHTQKSTYVKQSDGGQMRHANLDVDKLHYFSNVLIVITSKFP
eukprot:4446574-Ditylum_brightwellii.AAC.1